MYERLSMLFAALYCIGVYFFILFLSLADEIKLLRSESLGFDYNYGVNSWEFYYFL